MAAGLLLGLSLIVAIGAQNVYVLRQGMLRGYLPLVVGICSASDVVLIAAGVAGGGMAIGDRHWLLDVARTGDALFIFGYAALAARRAWRPATVPSGPARPATSQSAVTAACLAFTWLNPAVYLDNVVLVGSVANASPGRQWWFGAGAEVASTLWVLGARLRRPAGGPRIRATALLAAARCLHRCRHGRDRPSGTARRALTLARRGDYRGFLSACRRGLFGW
jgi:L-lysine exporter family protein LysE/ArgO